MAAEKKKAHSRFLFTDDNGEPLIFYMRPCAQKVTLKPLVEDGGGGMTVKVTRKCIKLAVEADQISSDDYISSKYIHDCVESNKLLAMDKYRLKPKKRSADLSVDEIDVPDDLSPASKIQRTEALPLGRSRYSLQDDLAILKHFEKNRELASMINGLKIWKDMSSLKVTEHSAESMKDRFKKRILPIIDSYHVSSSVKFLLTKKTKYLADSDHLIKEKTQKSAPQTTPKKRLTLSDNTDSFDQFLLDSIANSPKKGSNPPRTLQVVLKDVISPKSGKGKASPIKETVHVSPSKNNSKENKEATKEWQSKQKPAQHHDMFSDKTESTKPGLKKPAQHHDMFSDKTESTKPGLKKTSQTSNLPKVQSPRTTKEIDQHGGHALRKRKLTDTKHSNDTASQLNKNASNVRLKKKPKTDINQPSMMESQSDNSFKKKTPPGLTRKNILDSNGPDSTPDKAKRLNYVMEKFLESQDDEVTPPEHFVHDSEKLNSDDDEDGEKNVQEDEIEDTIGLVQKLMKQYRLTAKQVLHAFYINNGRCEDTVSWIETGLDTAGLPAWDHRDDRRLRSDDWNALETLKEKYGLKRVNNRLLFLEGL
ncbi:telomeric repeat-binding factor 2-interacting protein 1-like isoform X2 [Mizuhopecten yessoensis]|uniref:telomeric repeat-binding factor 2-interacting protein 1-like isoform X2 n=1 Tax=Mizuhopecten yessoensis TaxID=6573 RepID=UPI000B45AE9B|nr:telomeric repeat-binding factor 2-interacting protein 1-like isoform X2 [Mizuhopecten yessoensis]